jgi:hypothetical protein
MTRTTTAAAHLSFLRAVLCTLLATASAAAQCATPWLPGDGVLGTDRDVRAAASWDPDGAGPAPARLVVVGDFTVAGNVVAHRVAAWDAVAGTWSAFGAGLDSNVQAVAVLPNGDLVVGGDFTTAGGVAANKIARWDGTSWSPLGSGVTAGAFSFAQVLALLVLPNGDLIAGGVFSQAGGVAAANVARWDGTAWSALGAGVPTSGGGQVRTLATLANGDLVAGGWLGSSTDPLRRWNGSSWSSLGLGVSVGNTQVNGLARLPNGDLVAGGLFTAAGGVPANHIARWDGSAWSAMAAGADNVVFGMTVLPGGDVLALGLFTAAGVAAGHVARWDGSSWSAFGTAIGPGTPRCLLALPGGEVIAGGGFSFAGAVPTNHVARWNGSAWTALGTGSIGSVQALATRPNGDLVAGGSIAVAGGVAAHRIARFDGTAWSALGAGLDAQVLAVLALPNGDVVAGGSFTMAGAVAANRIARWNGAAWSPLGAGTDGDVHALATLPNGDLIAGGQFSSAGGAPAANVARWDGSAWSAMGPGLSSGGSPSVDALLVLANGDLLAAGVFAFSGATPATHIARWNGSAWSALGPGLNGSVVALAAAPGGDVFASGYFTLGSPTARIGRWDGTTWSGIRGGPAFALATLPNGDLVTGGDSDHLARWNGSSWSTLGAGLNGSVRALAARSDGTLFAGGSFTTAGGSVRAYVARLRTTCPATATTAGPGCPSSGGSNTLTATTLPWVDATFRATGTGLPLDALVIAATSFTAFAPGQQPLVSLLPQGVVGCDLLVGADILQVLLTHTGTAQSQLFLPGVPPLVGLTFYHQMVPIELDANLDWIAATATNALQLTAGAF